MEFTKIKYKKGTIELEWATNHDKDSLKHALTSTDVPEDRFFSALKALVPIVLDLLQLPGEYAEGLRVQSVSFTFDETQGRGCVITSLKELTLFNSPLVLNTPHLTEESEGGVMPATLIEALEELEDSAYRFKNGQRAQRDMFVEETK